MFLLLPADILSVRILKAVGRHMEVAIPWKARNKIIWIPLWATLQARMKAHNSVQPMRLISLLPMKSAIDPARRRQHPFARLLFSLSSAKVEVGRKTYEYTDAGLRDQIHHVRVLHFEVLPSPSSEVSLTTAANYREGSNPPRSRVNRWSVGRHSCCPRM